MKYSLLIVFAIFCLQAKAQVQQAPTSAEKRTQQEMSPEQKAQKQTERMSQKLNLSEEQSTVIYAINLKFINQGKPDQASKEDMQAMRKARETAYKEVLTEEQFQVWETERINRKQKNKAKAKGKIKHKRSVEGS